MLVFVCSTYRGKIQKNIANAISYCEMEMAMGNTPFAPHLYMPQFTSDDDMGIYHGLEFLQRCDQLHVWSDTITVGMKIDIDAAEAAGIPVVYMEVDNAE